MSSAPKPAAAGVTLANGVSAVAPGLLWLHESRVLVAADVHLAYEDVIGGALPVWSTPEIASTLTIAAQRLQAAEIVLLGDVIHGSKMSDGAAAAVRDVLEVLRRVATLTIVAGNHEGRSRGQAVLGETVECARRDGWLLLHGDRPQPHEKCIIGHLHPSLPLGPAESAPAFLAGEALIVVPALTPYSRGLNVLSNECLHALRPWRAAANGDLDVVAAAGELLYPFGSLARLRALLRSQSDAGEGSRQPGRMRKHQRAPRQ